MLMEDSDGFDVGDFNVEMEDFEYKQVKKFDRTFNVTPGGSIFQRPLVHDGVVHFGSRDHNVYAVCALDGKLRWKFTANDGFIVSSPCISDGLLYIGSLDHNIYALDAPTGRLAWKFRTMDKIVSPPAVHDGRLYIGSNDYNFYCLDAKTGRLIWKFPTRGEIQSTPVFHGGRVFFGSFDYNFYCVDESTGMLVWKIGTQGHVIANNVPIHEGRIYFPSFDNYLRAADVRTGKVAWKFLTGKYGMVCGPCLKDGLLFQTCQEGIVYCLTIEGREVWRFRTNYSIATPMIHRGRLYFGAEDNKLYCLSLGGKKLWTFEASDLLRWCPAACGDHVYFTSMDCFIYCIDIDAHSLAWKFRAEGEPSYIPPPFAVFELTVKKRGDDSGTSEMGGRKTYEIDGLDEESHDTYKSRITYRVSTQYSAKGKYQKDSDEEAF